MRSVRQAQLNVLAFLLNDTRIGIQSVINVSEPKKEKLPEILKI